MASLRLLETNLLPEISFGNLGPRLSPARVGPCHRARLRPRLGPALFPSVLEQRLRKSGPGISTGSSFPSFCLFPSLPFLPPVEVRLSSRPVLSQRAGGVEEGGDRLGVRNAWVEHRVQAVQALVLGGKGRLVGNKMLCPVLWAPELFGRGQGPGSVGSL